MQIKVRLESLSSNRENSGFFKSTKIDAQWIIIFNTTSEIRVTVSTCTSCTTHVIHKIPWEGPLTFHTRLPVHRRHVSLVTQTTITLAALRTTLRMSRTLLVAGTEIINIGVFFNKGHNLCKRSGEGWGCIWEGPTGWVCGRGWRGE